MTVGIDSECTAEIVFFRYGTTPEDRTPRPPDPAPPTMVSIGSRTSRLVAFVRFGSTRADSSPNVSDLTCVGSGSPTPRGAPWKLSTATATGGVIRPVVFVAGCVHSGSSMPRVRHTEPGRS